MGLLSGKVCLVTGTSRGIGKAVVEEFAKEGGIVYANARTEGCIDRECDDLANRYHTEIIPVYFDVRNTDDAKKAFMKIKKEKQRLDVLVNNAGVMRDALIGMADRKLMEDIFETNVFALMDMLQLAFKIMNRQGSGSIINLSSIVGLEGNAGQLVYSASKGAVAAITKTAAKELAEKKIRVNAVAPGMIDTEMFRSIGEEKVNDHLNNIKMGRLGTPDDVAKTIVYLASDLSEYVTGQIIGVDGGVMI